MGRQSINGFQRVNMSSPSSSYSDTESSTSSHSSSDKSVEWGEPSKHSEPGEPSKHLEHGEPSKRPELKVIISEALRNPWAPWGDVPIARVAPRQVALMLPVGMTWRLRARWSGRTCHRCSWSRLVTHIGLIWRPTWLQEETTSKVRYSNRDAQRSSMLYPFSLLSYSLLLKRDLWLHNLLPSTLQSWPWVIAWGMTAPPTLYWNVLRWNFDVECVDVILGHHVEYTGSMSTLPILVLQCS